ncbi:MAG: DUF2088 domain-containing protein [Planctomycetaceae bacterium]|nr:DUF2088 domain-containing protein [Planctomycetaceae bacterium]
MPSFTLHYGHDRKFDCEINQQVPCWHHRGPETATDAIAQIQKAIEAPVDYPQINQAVVKGDSVAIVVEPETPCWPDIVKALRELLISAGIESHAIRVALNREIIEQDLPANLSPEAVGKVVSHVDLMKSQQIYLASTAEGERIYLPEEIGNADVVISIGQFGFDDQWGYRGTHSVVYPAFASTEEQEKLRGVRQHELTPETSRGTRQTIDEIGWLLGLQYTVQVIPSASGQLADILSGACDSVYRDAVSLLQQNWRIQKTDRSETVVVSLANEPGCDIWAAITRTCRSAKTLVETDGRVMLLTDLKELPRELIDPLTMCGSLDEAMQMLNTLNTPEANALHAIADLAQTAKVYLLSGLDQDIVENLFCIPLANHEEMQNAIQGGESYAIVDGGPYVYVENE